MADAIRYCLLSVCISDLKVTEKKNDDEYVDGRKLTRHHFVHHITSHHKCGL